MVKEICPECHGYRLKPEALAVTIMGASISEVTALSIENAREWMETVMSSLSEKEKTIAGPIVEEIMSRLKFLEAVGLTI